MQQVLIPLFPLQSVLFPRTPLPLHIFEARYREMIGEAIIDKTEFGVVLAGSQGIANLGCSAIITRVVERHEDGPEIIALVLTATPKILGALAALAVAWCKVRGARRVKFQIGKHKYEGPIEGLAQFKAVVRTLEKVANAGR